MAKQPRFGSFTLTALIIFIVASWSSLQQSQLHGFIVSHEAQQIHTPSRKPPVGGLNSGDIMEASPRSPVRNPPQFIIITNDDEVYKDTVNPHAALRKDFKQRNGCPIPLTWFTTASNVTECQHVQQRWLAGDEIATHTITHPNLKFLDKESQRKEIVGSRQFLIDTCKIPKEDVAGFRAPFVYSNTITKEVLYEEGFLYEASLLYHPFPDAELVKEPVFPFTLHKGIPQDFCKIRRSQCTTVQDSWPGLWEVPLMSLVSSDGQKFAMDPGAAVEGNGEARPVFDVLKYNFDKLYHGNRAPLGFYAHEHWFETHDSISGGRQFIEYAMKKPDVYFITQRQLIEWMKLKIPANKVSSWLQSICGKPYSSAATGR